MSKHTATPWEVVSYSDKLTPIEIRTDKPLYPHASNSVLVAKLPHETPNPRANAAHIVQCVNERDSLLAQIASLREALEAARRDAYIRGFIRGYDKKSEIQHEGPQTAERVRAWAEGHAISYCDQFDDAALKEPK